MKLGQQPGADPAQGPDLGAWRESTCRKNSSMMPFQIRLGAGIDPAGAGVPGEVMMGLVETGAAGRHLVHDLQRPSSGFSPDPVRQAGLRPHRPQVATAEDLGRSAPRLPAAGEMFSPQIQEGETGIDRCFLRPLAGRYVFKIFLGMEKVAEPEVIAPRSSSVFPAKALPGWAGRRVPFREASVSRVLRPAGPHRPAGGTVTPDHHGMAVVIAPQAELSRDAWSLEDLNALGRTARPAPGTRGSAGDLGTEPARSGQQHSSSIPRRRRGNDRVLRGTREDTA